MLNGLCKSFKMSILEHKRSLRKSTLLHMKNVDIEERLRQSRHVSQTLIASKLYKNAKRISIYLSLPSEISTRWLLEDILKEGSNKICYVPDIVHDEDGTKVMRMLRVDSFEDLNTFIPKELNVLSPPDSNTRIEALEDGGLDLIIVPGVAFDASNRRLGRGKGYYDQYIHKVEAHTRESGTRMPPLVAIALNEQIVDHVPTSKHDKVLDYVIYENRKDVINF